MELGFGTSVKGRDKAEGTEAEEREKIEGVKLDGFVKGPNSVTPAKAGVQKLLK